jgi:hypothetical protein
MKLAYSIRQQTGKFTSYLTYYLRHISNKINFSSDAIIAETIILRER